mmetsp:Transcript_76017/g.163154  ORF Transcript_76017/g.163154 Transcript_76017/m.163154 type:complete len:223 (-) Transcript_76017:143-811(-)
MTSSAPKLFTMSKFSGLHVLMILAAPFALASWMPALPVPPLPPSTSTVGAELQGAPANRKPIQPVNATKGRAAACAISSAVGFKPMYAQSTIMYSAYAPLQIPQTLSPGLKLHGAVTSCTTAEKSRPVIVGCAFPITVFQSTGLTEEYSTRTRASLGHPDNFGVLISTNLTRPKPKPPHVSSSALLAPRTPMLPIDGSQELFAFSTSEAFIVSGVLLLLPPR